jgi:uncharacterized cupin superfamily protein
MTDRLLSSSVLRELLVHDGAGEGLDTAQSVLGRVGGTEVGLWEAGPGVDTDVEVDEIFLVLSGSGTITFADGGTVDLRPGVLVRLHSGEQTTGDITERIRKLYLA